MTRSDKHADVVLLAEEAPDARVIDGETPFIIGLVGDFGGGAGIRKPVAVDRDNIDDVLARMGIRLPLPFIGEYRIQELDDFDADRLAAVVGAAVAGNEVSEGPSTSPARIQPPGNLLEQIVADAAEPELTSAVPSSSEFGDFVEKLVKPHLTRPPDAREVQREKRVAQTVSAKLREILHSPAFQELEAAWRAVFMLVRRLETNERLDLYLIHVPQRELPGALQEDGPGGAALARMLLDYSERTLDGNRWSVLVANCMFASAEVDVAQMGGLAKLGRLLGAPVIAGAKPELVGCPSWENLTDPGTWQDPDPAWQVLRRSARASYLGLAMPRFLLRLPYGKDSLRCESIDFEEMEIPPEHGHYLWANPAFGCALLLGEAFQRHGWQFRPGVVNELEGLPLHLYKLDGSAASTSCAETWLNESAMERILASGVMPFVSWRNTGRARLARFQSIADPPAPLSGPWSF